MRRHQALIDAVSEKHMRESLFALSRDPFPFRKLNLTLPGHSKSTLAEADDWMETRLRSWGFDVRREECPVQAYTCNPSKPLHHWYDAPDPNGPWYTAANLFAERTGTELPAEIVLLVAHKDSQSWIDCPGANDNAIGASSLLEMARVIAGLTPKRTIRFLLCNEEHAPWTSITAAANARVRGDNLIAVVNMDGIGVKSDEDRAAGKLTNVTMTTVDEGEPLAALMGWANNHYALGLDQAFRRRECSGDDDGSFVNAGYGCTILNIGSFPYADPEYHLAGDVPERTDVRNAAVTTKATLAVVLRVAEEGI